MGSGPTPVDTRKAWPSATARGDLEPFMHLVLSHCTVDFVARQIRWLCGDEYVLTPIEAKLLSHLVALEGAVANRQALLERVWGYRPTIETRAVDAAVRRLRKKLEPDPRAPRHLVTEWGVGYRLLAPGSRHPGADPVLACLVLQEADGPAGTLRRCGAQLCRDICLRELTRWGGYWVRADGDEVLVAFVSTRQALAWCRATRRALLCEGLESSAAVVAGGASPKRSSPSARFDYVGPGVRVVRDHAARAPVGAIVVGSVPEPVPGGGVVDVACFATEGVVDVGMCANARVVRARVEHAEAAVRLEVQVEELR